MSRIDDPNDYSLDPSCIRYTDEAWGPHTVDRFASVQTRRLERYCSRYGNPRRESVAAGLYILVVKGEQLAFSSPISPPTCNEAHVR